MKLIADLIEVPPIRTVIQLVDAGSAQLREELLDSFVFTHEIHDLFSRLLTALGRQRGLGAFLKGHYGSGKSHCLTFLRLLLEGDPRALARLPGGLVRPDRPWLVVSVPLHVYPAQTRLEDALMESLEAALSKDGKRPVLAERSRLLDNFRLYVYPVYKARLPGWEALGEEEAAAQALEFLRSLPDNPLKLSYDRRQVMERVEDELDGRGVVFLLDELSEFLRSKGQDQSAFHEDIRYLQFIGEWAEKMPLWIVASLQQNLEELGYGEEEGYLRIKERYPLRFTLSARHVADLIEGRLIRRKPGSDEIIAGLWKDFQRVYPGVIAECDFLRIYPVHPATLEMLENLMTLFSRHRGVVDFVHTRLAGDPLKGARGILQEPLDRLLTPDSIFDHFRERFSELAHLAPYEQTVWAHLSEEIPRVFESDREREMALAVVKLLILAEVSPVPVERSAASLARMLARRVSKLNAQINIDFLKEKVLDVLVARSAFVVVRGQEYGLDLQANSNQLLGRRIREKRQEVLPDWEQALPFLRSPLLPLSDLVARRTHTLNLSWRGSERKLAWSLMPLAASGFSQLSATLLRLDYDEDAALWMALPGDEPEAARKLVEEARRHPRGAGFCLWLPAVPDADAQDLLLDWLAHRAVLAEARTREARSLLSSLVEEQQTRLGQLLLELYLNGRVYTLEGERPAPAREISRDKMFAGLLGAGLERLYPRFASIAPQADTLTRHNLKRFWEELIRPGACSLPSTLDLAISGVMAPLGLVEKTPDSWRVKIDPGGPVGEILNRLLPGQRHKLSELQRQILRCELGPVREQWALLLAALVQSGRVQLYSAGRAMSLIQINQILDFKADEAGLAQTLDEAQLARLGDLQWMVPEGLSPAKSREFWQAARDRLSGIEQTANDFRRGWERSGSPPQLREVAQHARKVAEVAAAVGTPSTSVTGLARLLDQGAGGLRESEEVLHLWREFTRENLPEFVAARARMERMGLRDFFERSEEIWNSSQPSEEWRSLRELLLDKEAGYRVEYGTAHQAYYASPVFGLGKELSASSEWRAVRALGGVLGVTMEPPPPRLQALLAQLPAPCRRKVEEQLLLGNLCGCGFVPGQPLPQVEDLLEPLRRALSSGCRSLLEGESRLEQYLQGLHQLGQAQRVAHLEKVLAAAASLAVPSEASNFWNRAPDQLLALLDAPTVEALSQALTGHTLVVQRSLASLLGSLQEQRLPLNRVRQIFEQWLQGPDLRADSWVYLQGSQAPSSPAGAWLGRWLSQHGLEPTAAMRRRYRLEGEPEGDPPEAELRELIEPLARELDAVKAAGAERIFEGLSRDFCVRALSGLALGLRLPDLSWPHLAVARIVAGVWEGSRHTDYPGVARAVRDWARARHLDLAAEWLTPTLEEKVEAALREALEQAQLDPLPLEQVPSRLVASYLGDRRLFVVVVDGLRWDLWDLMREEIVADLGPPVEERLALSPLPSVTFRARQVLLGGEELVPAGADGMLLNRPLTLVKAADEKKARPRLEELWRGREPSVMLHLGFIDKRRHETSLDLWPLYGELLAEARLRLFPLLRRVPPGSLLLLTADHGFTDPSNPRAHGGDRWEERVVPAALWLR